MIAIIAPCFNEQDSVIHFLKGLENILADLDEKFHVIVVDDCSQDTSLSLLTSFTFHSKNIRFEILQLKFNVGQQEAIYQGLLYAGRLSITHAIVIACDVAH